MGGSEVEQIGEVSIHAPVWGATQGAAAGDRGETVSIHAPVWGATTVGGVVVVP